MPLPRAVMAGLVPAIHANAQQRLRQMESGTIPHLFETFPQCPGVDGRHKAGHDGVRGEMFDSRGSRST